MKTRGEEDFIDRWVIAGLLLGIGWFGFMAYLLWEVVQWLTTK